MKTTICILFIFLIMVSVHAQTGQVEYLPGSTVKISQLVGDYDRQKKTQTRNLTESRYGLISTDLGVPFYHNGRTYVLFGDSWGVPAGDAIAYTTDINPEDGIDLTFITDGSGIYKPVTVPGIGQEGYEVPMEGVSIEGKMYIYLTTDNSDTVVMGRSVVAVSEDDGETFRYLYDLSQKHFINVSIVDVDPAEWPGFPMDTGSGLVLFGTGEYRQSDVRLAFQPADQIEMPQSLLYYTGLSQSGVPIWSVNEDDAIPLFFQSCIGELSVTFNPFLQKWLMLYNCDSPRGINFRTADSPWGPWSETQLLFDPWLDNGYCHFMHVDWQFSQCDSLHDPGREYEWGGEYGPYQFGDLAVGNDTTTTIYFTLSTWNPYTVVLMKSTLNLLSPSTPVDTENPALAAQFLLMQNFPNPFNAETVISYQLNKTSFITMSIMNLAGEKVITLVDEEIQKGMHFTTWSGINHRGVRVTSGVYLLVMEAEDFKTVRRMVLLR